MRHGRGGVRLRLAREPGRQATDRSGPLPRGAQRPSLVAGRAGEAERCSLHLRPDPGRRVCHHDSGCWRGVPPLRLPAGWIAGKDMTGFPAAASYFLIGVIAMEIWLIAIVWGERGIRRG